MNGSVAVSCGDAFDFQFLAELILISLKMCFANNVDSIMEIIQTQHTCITELILLGTIEPDECFSL
jgi:hypothetical protein